jgi:hypothetical protein
MSTQFYDTQVTTVDYQILFTKRDREALLDSGRTIVTSAMAGSGFASWQISLFIGKLNNVGIPKPADWTNRQADELALDVTPRRYAAAVAAAKVVVQNNASVPLAQALVNIVQSAVNAAPGNATLATALASAQAQQAAPNQNNALAAEAAVAAAADEWPVQTVKGLKAENLKYLQVDHQIISTLDRKPPRYDADQVDALRDIATVIKNRP